MRDTDGDKRVAAVQLVAARQRQEKVPDARVAARLGVSESAWSLVRTGKRRPGIRVMRGMMAAYPETTPLLIAFFLPTTTQVSHV